MQIRNGPLDRTENVSMEKAVQISIEATALDAHFSRALLNGLACFAHHVFHRDPIGANKERTSGLAARSLSAMVCVAAIFLLAAITGEFDGHPFRESPARPTLVAFSAPALGQRRKPEGIQAFCQEVALPSWQVLGVSRINQIDLEATFFQNVIQGIRYTPGRLQGHGLHSATLRPVG
jgi:hypothetical protein